MLRAMLLALLPATAVAQYDPYYDVHPVYRRYSVPSCFSSRRGTLQDRYRIPWESIPRYPNHIQAPSLSALRHAHARSQFSNQFQTQQANMSRLVARKQSHRELKLLYIRMKENERRQARR